MQDVNPQPLAPEAITPVGDRIDFLARDADGFYALWSSDGSAAGTAPLAEVRDLTGPFNGTGLPKIIDFRGAPVFLAVDPSTNKEEVRRVDPVTGQVTAIAAFLGQDEEADLMAPTPAGDHLFFRSLTSTPDGLGGDLFVSDGTAAGTRRLAIPSWTAPPSYYRAALGDSILLGATDAAHGEELWISDGSVAGTHLVADLAPGPTGSSPTNFMSIGGKVYFSALVSGNTQTFFVTDGTAAGTVPLIPYNVPLGSAVEAAGKVFAFPNGPSEPPLYITDGTPGGTISIPLSPPGNPYGFYNVGDLVAAGDRVFFTIKVIANGWNYTQLWTSDGTAAGTHFIFDDIGSTRPGDGTSYPPELEPRLAGLNGRVVFAHWDATHGRELWESDGTAAGTGPVADLLPGPEGSDPTGFTRVGEKIYFAARDAQGGNELWSTDGTAAGTLRIAILPTTATDSSYVESATGGPLALSIGATTYFVAHDPDHGAELWKTDGTPSGTALVDDLEPGPTSSIIPALTDFGGRLYFPEHGAPSGDWRLMASDGTPGGTTVAVDLGTLGIDDNGYIGLNHPPDVSAPMPVLGDRMYFLGRSSGSLGLYATDGTPAGTARVADLGALPYTGAGGDLTASGGRLYFVVQSDTTTNQLWTSDGTDAGTHSIFQASEAGSPPYFQDLTDVNGLLYFRLFDRKGGVQLYRSDGTAEGTFRLGTDTAGVAYAPLAIAAFGPFAYYGGTDASGEVGVYRTDGTPAGTTRFLDLGAGSPYATPNSFLVVGGTLYFDVEYGPLAGVYRSDGTVAGTVRIVSASDLGDPAGKTDFEPLLDANGAVAFATFGKDEVAVYRTDGTTAGTIRLARIGTTNGTGSAALIRAFADDSLLLFASDGLHGTEPLVVDDTPATNHPPTLLPIADVNTPAGQTVRLVASASDPDPGQTIRYSLGAGAPAGATIDPVTGAFSWTPPESILPDRYEILVRATDDGSPSAFDLVRFNVYVSAPEPPTLDAIPDASVDQGASLAFRASAHDPSALATLRYSLDPGAPAGATIDATTGLFTYRPAGHPAPASITVRVTDLSAPQLSAARTFRVSVANRPPTLSLGGDAALIAGSTLLRPGSVADPGGDPVVATVDYGDGSGPQPLAIAPDGSFRLDHLYAAAGPYLATVTAADDLGAATSATIRIDVQPAPVGSFAFAAPDFAGSERAGLVTITVVRLGGSAGTATVAYATRDGSAHDGSDDAATSGTLTFADGETSKTFTVPLIDDHASGGVKTLSLVLSSPGGGAPLADPAVATLTIADDGLADPAPPPATVTAVLPIVRRGGITEVVVQLSGPAPAASMHEGVFRLTRVVKRGRHLALKAVPVKGMTYDAARQSIHLLLKRKLPARTRVRLQVAAPGIRGY